MNEFRKQWLTTAPWESVLTVNQALCQAQKTTHQAKEKASEAARQLWEKAVPQTMSLKDVLDVCRRCHELSPFTFNNGNTFAAISKTLIEDWLKELPPVEAQVIRTTVAHYVAGQVGQKELLQVLRHFETTWKVHHQANAAPPSMVRRETPDAGASPSPVPAS